MRAILAELELGDKQELMVYNKADLVPPFEAMARSRSVDGVAVSARDKTGLDKLVAAIGERLWQVAAIDERRPWESQGGPS